MRLAQSVAGSRWSGTMALLFLLGALAWGVTALANWSTVDGIALLMALLTVLISVIVLAFSRRFMRADQRRTLFTLQVVAFTAAMVVLAFARDLISFALAWCASGQLLVSLVRHSNGCGEAELAARRCRRSFLVGDSALLIAFVVLGRAADSLMLSDVSGAMASLSPSVLLTAAVLLVTAAAVRCALPPFSGWLLGSMSAPTPVSALMHAGFVNGGGFLVIRFATVLNASPAVQGTLLALGLLAALYGGAVMLVRPDIKGALAGSTVSQMGFMLLTCGLGAYAAALWHLIAHGLFKAWLFLSSGSTIGMLAPGSSLPRRASHAALISAVTIVMVFAASQTGLTDPAILPQALAIAAGLSAIDLVYRRRAWPMLILAAIALTMSMVVVHAMTQLVTDQSRFVGGMLPIAVLLILLGGWVAQRFIANRGLAAPLYVRLVNSSALHGR